MKKIIIGMLGVLVLFGCGSESNQSGGDYSTKLVSTYQDLPQCNSNRSGHLYYVEDSTNFFVCKSNAWQSVRVGNGVYGKIGCVEEINNAVLSYVMVIFRNGDSFISCSAFTPGVGESSYSEYHAYDSTAGRNLSCGLTHATNNGVVTFYEFESLGNSNFRVTYENYNTGAINARTFSSSACMANTYE